jgi:hypothetical protein
MYMSPMHLLDNRHWNCRSSRNMSTIRSEVCDLAPGPSHHACGLNASDPAMPAPVQTLMGGTFLLKTEAFLLTFSKDLGAPGYYKLVDGCPQVCHWDGSAAGLLAVWPPSAPLHASCQLQRSSATVHYNVSMLYGLCLYPRLLTQHVVLPSSKRAPGDLQQGVPTATLCRAMVLWPVLRSLGYGLPQSWPACRISVPVPFDNLMTLCLPAGCATRAAACRPGPASTEAHG